MIKISLVCASASRFNSGMLSVDAAWNKIASKSELNIKTTKFRFNEISFDGETNEDYKCLIEDYEEFINADKIIYWGDFLHMHRYHVRKAKMLFSTGKYNTIEDALDLVQKRLLLKSEPLEVKQKSLAFGGNLLLESFDDLVKKPHQFLLKDFASNALSYLPRDFYSAQLVSSLRKDASYTQGVDCAMLGWKHNFDREENYTNWRTNGNNLGIFFGRSVNKIPKMILFSKLLSKKMDLNTNWIQWLDNTKGLNKQNLVKKLTKSFVVNEDNPVDDYTLDLNNLKKFKLIVTDTYHLAVNAWCAGVPVLCIADIYRPNRLENVNSGAEFNWRDKRYFHFMMYDLLDFYMHQSELNSMESMNKRIKHVLHNIENEDKMKWIYNRMKNQLEKSEESLIKAIEI